MDFENGLFAAPWGQHPIAPYFPPEVLYTFQPPLLPQFMPLRDNIKAAGGPPLDQLMRSIRDVAVFAWALVGINGNLATYGRGIPTGESQPPDGIPIWDPNAGNQAYLGPENQAARRWAEQDEEQHGKQSRVPHARNSYLPETQAFLRPDPSTVTYGRPAGWLGSIADSYVGTHDSVARQQQQHQLYHAPNQCFQPPSHPRFGRPQEPWEEASPPERAGQDSGIPAAQSENSRDSRNGYFYGWQ